MVQFYRMAGACTAGKKSEVITKNGFTSAWEHELSEELQCNMRSIKLHEWTVMLSIPTSLSEHHHQLHLLADCSICHNPIRLCIELAVEKEVPDPNFRPIMKKLKATNKKCYKLSQVGTCMNYSVDEIGKAVWETFDKFSPYCKLSNNCQHFCSEVTGKLCSGKKYLVYAENFKAKGSCC